MEASFHDEAEEKIGLIAGAEYEAVIAGVLLGATELAADVDRLRRWEDCVPDSAEKILSKIIERRLARRTPELERQMAVVAAMRFKDASIPRDGDLVQVQHVRGLLRREKQTATRQLAGVENATGWIRAERVARLEETFWKIATLTAKIRQLESAAGLE